MGVKEQFNEEYAKGKWALLKDLEEVARYAVISGFLVYMCKTPSVLDVGCGEGILLDYLRACGYSQYLGIDISSSALSCASSKIDSRTNFVVADAEEFCPNGIFDCVIFNESLYYFENPLDTIQRYTTYLREGGIFVTSMFMKGCVTESLLKDCIARFRCIESLTIHNSRGIWKCNLFTT